MRLFFHWRKMARKPAGGFFLALLVVVSGLLGGCGQDPGPVPPTVSDKAGEDTFTFFAMGRYSVLNDAVRDRLQRELGAEAVSRRGLVDLELVGPGWLGSHLPMLDALNRRLNKDFRERVEHEVLILRYNYPARSSPAFEKVLLVFDLRTRRPLYFDILANAAGAEIIEVLRDKYGPPAGRTDAQGEALLWEKGGDRLVIVPRTNRMGQREYLIGIYFVENIESLLAGKSGAPDAKDGRGGAKAF